MPSIILSDNGVSSGSAGLKSTAASDGVLVLQTTTSGGTATNAVYVDTSQLVGLGTTPSAKLHLLTTGNTTADGVRLTFGSEARSHNIYSALPTGRDLTIAPYRSLTINTGSGTNEGIVTLNSYEYTVFGTGSSYTERMRLDASGNLGLGTTSPKLNGNAGTFLTVSNTTSDQTGWLELQGAPTATNSGAGIISFNSSNRAGADKRIAQITCARGSASDSGFLTFSVWNAGTGAEAARIDTSGNLLVGTTTASGKIFAVNDASSARQCIRGDQSYDGAAAIYGRHTVNSATGFCAYFTNSGSGTGLYIANTAAWQSTSDARLKTDVQDLDSTARLMQLRPVDYLWKNQATSNEPTKRSFGFIAQEVQEVFPELVSTSPDEMLGVEYTGLIAPLVKAIQELKAELDTAKAEIAALKGTQP